MNTFCGKAGCFALGGSKDACKYAMLFDTAMVRVTLLDVAGVPVTRKSQARGVRFSVVSGAGRILGIGSGDPAGHEPQQGDTVATWAATARALVQVFDFRLRGRTP